MPHRTMVSRTANRSTLGEKSTLGLARANQQTVGDFRSIGWRSVSTKAKKKTRNVVSILKKTGLSKYQLHTIMERNHKLRDMNSSDLSNKLKFLQKHGYVLSTTRATKNLKSCCVISSLVDCISRETKALSIEFASCMTFLIWTN